MGLVFMWPSYSTGAHGVAQVQRALERGLKAYGWAVSYNKADAARADVKHVHALASDVMDWDVYTSHGFFAYPSTQLEASMREMQRRTILASRYVTSCAAHWARVMERFFGCDVEVIPNGYWEDEIAPLRTQDRGNYVLWAKNNITNKTTRAGYDLAVEVARRVPDVQFLFTISDERRLPSNVRVIGLKERTEYLRLVARAGAYLSTCHEAFSLAVVEAQALGVPVVGVNTGGNVEAVVQGETGELAEADPDKIAERLRLALANKARLGANAMEYCKRFEWGQIVPRYVALYEVAMRGGECAGKGKVSVVITVYNGERWVKNAVQSALSQTSDRLLEVIVIDDGSTDGTAAVLSEYDGDLVRVVRTENRGVSAARNLGVALARGEYVCCLDCDDEIAERFVEKLAAALDAAPTAAVAYSDMWVFEDGKENEGAVVRAGDWGLERLKRGNVLPCCNLFRKKAWQWAGGYKELHPSWEDYDLWLTMAERGWDGVHVAEPLFRYRVKRGEGRNYESQPYAARLRAQLEAYHPGLWQADWVAVLDAANGIGAKLAEAEADDSVRGKVRVWAKVKPADRWAWRFGRGADPRVQFI